MGGNKVGNNDVDVSSIAENFTQYLEFKASIKRLVRRGDSIQAAELCVTALHNEFQINYVQALIRKYKLMPKLVPLDSQHWPWTLKVYTLGRFSVLLDGSPLDVSGKSQRKPIELFKALIAFGGRDVNEIHLCEALWPDAEGDQAHSAFTTTLSRLRKLIGANLLPFKNGLLSLNDRYCRVDSWVFERTLSDLELLLADIESGQKTSVQKKTIQTKVDRVFELYHGQFMEKEPMTGWILPLRERLHTKFMRIIKSLVQFYRNGNGHCKNVITLYEKARELDPYSEEYCRGLMRCHAAQGNRSEALAIYDRCHSMWTEAFGVKPSDKTTALYQLIKSCEQERFRQFCEFCPQLSD